MMASWELAETLRSGASREPAGTGRVNRRPFYIYGTLKIEPHLMRASEDARRMLELRQELGKTSNKKYNALETAVCADGRVRGLLQFYGAARTGRWCLTGDHEVLTPDGWVPLEQWQGGEIACWNPQTEVFSFQQANDLSFDYEGEMIQLSTFAYQRDILRFGMKKYKGKADNNGAKTDFHGQGAQSRISGRDVAHQEAGRAHQADRLSPHHRARDQGALHRCLRYGNRRHQAQLLAGALGDSDSAAADHCHIQLDGQKRRVYPGSLGEHCLADPADRDELAGPHDGQGEADMLLYTEGV